MDGYPQVISMQRAVKKILLLLLAVFILTPFFFLGTDYFEKQLAFFSSIITAWVTINPLEAEVSAPAEVEINKVFEVEARAINKGEEKIENAKGEIFLPSGLVLIQKDPVKEIGVIPGKREKKISWSVKGEKVKMENYIISVKVSGELKGQIISAEDSTLIEVKESVKKTGPRSRFQNFFDFFQERFGF